VNRRVVMILDGYGILDLEVDNGMEDSGYHLYI